MIFNARTDTVYFVKIADIDDSVFEFVNNAAEKQSKKNEQVLKLRGIKLKGKTEIKTKEKYKNEKI